MAALDGHVNRVLGEARRDHRLVLLGVAEGRRTMDTLMRLLLIHQRSTSSRIHSCGGTSALQSALDCAARSGSPFPTRGEGRQGVGTIGGSGRKESMLAIEHAPMGCACGPLGHRPFRPGQRRPGSPPA